MSDPTTPDGLRAHLHTALNAAPHYTWREVIDTVMRVLAEPRGDLRDQIAEALGHSLTQWWQTPPRLYLAADAVMPVIEAALAAETISWEGVLEGMEARLAEYIGRTQQAEQDARRLKGLAEGLQAELRAAITAQGQAEDALRELVDARPCDPHPGTGYCQTHGEKRPCPHAAAARLLAALDADQPKETR